MASFFEPAPAGDERYEILRASEWVPCVDARAFVESMWSQCAPFLDRDLPDRASRGFLPVFWELYVAYTLRLHSVNLVPRAVRTPARKGPDLLVRDGRVWIEAALPTSGTGADAVPERPTDGSVYAMPDEQMKLRLRSVIEEKHIRLIDYEAKGWVRPSDPVVIAVGGAGLPHRSELTLPRIVRCVFPLGHEQVHVSVDSLEIVGRGFQYQAMVQKASGEHVRTDVFLDSKYSRISAVLYSASDELNRPAVPGSDFVLVHNPQASVPLPRDWLSFSRCFWVEGDQLKSREPSRTEPPNDP